MFAGQPAAQDLYLGGIGFRAGVFNFSLVIHAALQGRYGWAIAMVVWGILVVGNVDNVIRPYVFSRWARIHPFITVIGALGSLVFGLALVGHLDIGFGTGWVSAAIALWVVAMALGGAGGRTARHARYLAERLAREGDQPNEELGNLVAHRPSLLLSYAATAAIVAILVLMVWQPS